MSLELKIPVKIEGAPEADKLYKAIIALTDQTAKLAAGMSSVQAASAKTSESFTTSVVKANLLTEAIKRGAEAYKEWSIEAAKYAARTQTLGVVADQLARVNGLSVQATRHQIEEVKRLGITTQDSTAVINKMIFAQLDLRKATDLARISQNAAVIAGINSSEALSGIIHGIVTRQPEVLRTYGLIVDFEAEYSKAAKQIGRDLTSVEKQQLALNLVLQQAPKIAGAYEASMLTAGKQMTSLSRHVDEAKNAIGEGLIPALSSAVNWMAKLAKFAQENGEAFTKMASGVTAAGVAAATFRFMPGPIWVKGGAAAIAAGATYAFGTQDPIASYSDNAQAGIQSIIADRRRINQELEKGGLSKDDAEGLKKQFAATADALKMVERSAADMAAKVFLQRAEGDEQKALFLAGEAVNKGTLNFGLGTTQEAITEAILSRADTDPNGVTFNRAAYEKAIADAIAVGAGARAAKAQKQRDAAIEKLLSRRHLRAASTFQFGDELDPGYDQAIYRDAMEFGSIGLLGQQDILTPTRKLPGAEPISSRKSFGLLIPKGVDPAAQMSLDMYRDAVRYKEQLIQLTAGPNGEYDAARKVRDLRLSIAEDEREAQQARMEFEVRIAEIDKRRRDELRNGIGQAFDAAVSSGSSGIGALVKSQFLSVARTVSMNLGEDIFGGLSSKMPNLGKAFRGTMFGGDGGRAAALELSGSAMNLNTAASNLTQAAASISGAGGAYNGGGGMAGAIGGAIGAGEGFFDDPSGGSGSMATSKNKFLGWFGNHKAAIGKGIGVAAAGFGVYSGIKQGGFGGAMTSVASALGGASLFAGPAAPFLQAGALIAGFVGSIFGNSKQKRANEIDSMLSNTRVSQVNGTVYGSDMEGRSVDYDYRGGMRLTQTVTVEVKTMDAKSFMDNRHKIADAVRAAIGSGSEVFA